jgi:CheY-like chemotaxis protein
MSDLCLKYLVPQSKVVLYVDDDEDDRDIFFEVMRVIRPDLRLVLAKDGQDALEKLQTSAYPLCMYIDMNMPKMNGVQLLRILKDDPNLSEIPAFILTTSLTPFQKSELITLGAKDYLIKPSSFEEFKNLLNSSLAKHLS